MLETAVALALGHAAADFLLQTDAMVRYKSRPTVLLKHVAIVGAASWAALGFALAPLLLALVMVTHYAIDWTKIRWGGTAFMPFALDQAAHLVVIGFGAWLFPDAFRGGLWGVLGADARLPQAMTLAAGAIATVTAGDHAVRAMMQNLATPDPSSLPRGGRLIGRLERTMILMLVLADQAEAVGFLIAAKSLLRFNELVRDADRSASEYVIIGTLASFAWGFAAAFATGFAFRSLGP